VALAAQAAAPDGGSISRPGRRGFGARRTPSRSPPGRPFACPPPCRSPSFSATSQTPALFPFSCRLTSRHLARLSSPVGTASGGSTRPPIVVWALGVRSAGVSVHRRHPVRPVSPNSVFGRRPRATPDVWPPGAVQGCRERNNGNRCKHEAGIGGAVVAVTALSNSHTPRGTAP
jgi:hypothetical protein